MPIDPRWPYPPLAADDLREPPTWTCPEGICECRGSESVGPFEFSVLLCRPTGERMAHAPCRVVASGAVLSDQQPCTDGSGWMTVSVPRQLESVLLQWAPPDLPQRADLPYTKRFWVRLHLADRDEAARRRLHNLGFGGRANLRESIKAYQRHYDHLPVTGELDDVEDELTLYHDHGCVPLTSPPPERPEARFVAAAAEPPAALPQYRDLPLLHLCARAKEGVGPEDADGLSGPATPQSPPPPPPSRGGTKYGGGTLLGQGTALPSAVLPRGRTRQPPSPITWLDFDVLLPSLRAGLDQGNPDLRLATVRAIGRVRSSSGGYVFMRQFLEYALIIQRHGSDVTVSYVYPGVDTVDVMSRAGLPYGSRTKLKTGVTTSEGTDPPGYQIVGVQISPPVRVTIHMAAAYRTYFMYSANDPKLGNKPAWIALAGERWEFHSVATGLSGSGNQWFSLCQRKSKARDGWPLDPDKIPPPDTPLTNIKNRAEGHFVLPASPTEKTALEEGC